MLSSESCWSLRSPVGDGGAVVVFDADHVFALGLALRGGVGCRGGVAPARVAALRGAGGELELAELAVGQGGPLVVVVLLLGQQLPGQADQLADTATVAILLARLARTRAPNARSGPGARIAACAASQST